MEQSEENMPCCGGSGGGFCVLFPLLLTDDSVAEGPQGAGLLGFHDQNIIQMTDDHPRHLHIIPQPDE
jgi:hypothetical protein